MRLVIVESPYAGKGASPQLMHEDQLENERYLSACLRHCVLRGESPYASHRMLTAPGVLDDTDPQERQLGITAGFAFRERTEASVFYVDQGISKGMLYGLRDALSKKHAIEFRSILWDAHPVYTEAELVALRAQTIAELDSQLLQLS